MKATIYQVEYRETEYCDWSIWAPYNTATKAFSESMAIRNVCGFHSTRVIKL